jgi:hypothetical protein
MYGIAMARIELQKNSSNKVLSMDLENDPNRTTTL